MWELDGDMDKRAAGSVPVSALPVPPCVVDGRAGVSYRCLCDLDVHVFSVRAWGASSEFVEVAQRTCVCPVFQRVLPAGSGVVWANESALKIVMAFLICESKQ